MGTEVHFAKDNISFYEDDRLLDTGKLTVNESLLEFEGRNRQFSISYPSICLHAISSNPYGGEENLKFPTPHIYLLVEGDRVWSNGEPIPPNGDSVMEVEEEEEGSDDDESGDYPADETPATHSLRFVPPDVRDLEPIYEAIAQCQALNPDADDMSDSDFEDADEDENGVDDNGVDNFDPNNFTDD